MTDPFVQALRDWQTFYFMIGTASATLIGLMFVAMSLAADLPAARNSMDINTYVAPILIHFGKVLAVSLVMLVPTFRLTALGITLLVIGLVSAAYSCWVGWQFARHRGVGNITPGDWQWHIFFPIIGDVLVMVMAVWLLSGSLDALDLLAAALGILLLVSVRNTWDLMMWTARNRQSPPTSPNG